MRPFFSYFGSKYRLAGAYPRPRYERLVEPFAGAAGYATRHYRHRVLLIEKNPKVAAVWRFLISSTPADILRMPLIEYGQRVTDLDCCAEARALIGFLVNNGCTAPRGQLSKWSRFPGKRKHFWGEEIRRRIARQVAKIRHWTVIEGDYALAPDIEATWFVDPPYQVGGEHYPCSSRQLDFEALGAWCRSRRGQVIVCEREGANWLPFRPLLACTHGVGGRSHEAIWTPEPEGQQALDFEGAA